MGNSRCHAQFGQQRLIPHCETPFPKYWFVQNQGTVRDNQISAGWIQAETRTRLG